jgi:hypothetical protein
MSWSVPILTYHALHAPGWEYNTNDHVALEMDLARLRELGYRVVPLSILVQHLFVKAVPRLGQGLYVGLSFDDGTDLDYYDFSHPDYGDLKSFHTVLSSQAGMGWDGGIPTATSFVIASPQARAELDESCIAGRDQWRDSWWLEAARGGVLEIANHSWDHTHVSLDTIAIDEKHRGHFNDISDYESADAEILQAEHYIRQVCEHRSSPLFAYPYGEYNEFLAKYYFPARSQWFEAAFTTADEPVTADSKRWLMPRYVCGQHWDTPAGLEAILACDNA